MSGSVAILQYRAYIGDTAWCAPRDFFFLGPCNTRSTLQVRAK